MSLRNKRILAALSLFVLLVTGAAAQRQNRQARTRAPKPPDLEVVEASAHRSEGKISLDGRVRNSGLKPLERLVLIFDLLNASRGVVTTQKAPAEEGLLEPGQESVFRVELNDPVRAVEFRLGATDRNGIDLRVANAGPFIIE
jgi:hypothetical protein